MPIIKTTYTPDELAKVPAGKHTFIDEQTARELLASNPLDQRIYAFASIPGGRDQIIAIKSEHALDKYDLHAVWVSGNTIADIIKQKGA